MNNLKGYYVCSKQGGSTFYVTSPDPTKLSARKGDARPFLFASRELAKMHMKARREYFKNPDCYYLVKVTRRTTKTMALWAFISAVRDTDQSVTPFDKEIMDAYNMACDVLGVPRL